MILRQSFGSYPQVDRVYAYDPFLGRASVRFRFTDGTLSIDTVSVSDLEAIAEPGGVYGDVDKAIRSFGPAIITHSPDLIGKK